MLESQSRNVRAPDTAGAWKHCEKQARVLFVVVMHEWNTNALASSPRRQTLCCTAAYIWISDKHIPLCSTVASPRSWFHSLSKET